MKSTPYFSIITCTYNSKQFIEDNINSVENQTFNSFEHIFIDGNSTDGTLEILNKYKGENPGKVKIFHSPAKGISNAMNVGISKGTGQYMLHLHGDDYLNDYEVLSDVEKYLTQHPDLDWIYGQIRVIEGSGKEIGIFPKRKIFQLNWSFLLKFINFIPHQAVFIKREVFANFGAFNETLHTAMDQDLWFRLNYKTKWKYFNRVISSYRVHQQAESSGQINYKRNRREYEKVQSQYLGSWFERRLAHIFHFLEEKLNKTTR